MTAVRVGAGIWVFPRVWSVGTWSRRVLVVEMAAAVSVADVWPTAESPAARSDSF
jgi:hypothetical protein